MRILITGSRGLLGAAIHREFRGQEVIALDHSALDITDVDAVARAIGDARPDVVVNCAAVNDVDGAEEDPVTALTVNGFAIQTLGRAAAAAGAILVHFSSDFVFDGETDRPYREEDPPNPRSVYGASKLLGDWFALAGPRAYVLRVESLFGEPGSSGSRRGSLGSIVDRILQGVEVPVFIDRVVSPTYTKDIGDAIAHLLRSSAAFGLYHCVNSGQSSWQQIAEHVAAVLNRPLHTKPLTLESAALRARRPRYCAMSNEKLAGAGYVMPHWRDSIKEFLRELR